MSKDRKKVIKFKRMPDINIGFVLFAIIFVYMLICVLIYAFSKKTVICEVTAGSLAFNGTYKGFIIRNEQVVKTPYSGNINFFTANKEKVAVGSLICTVDETGRVHDKINANINGELDKEEILKVKNMITDFSVNYDSSNYKYIYDSKENILSTIYECQSNNIVEHLDEYISSTDSLELFHLITSPYSGVVSYYIDGYEDVDESVLTTELFKNEDYTPNNLQTLKLVNKDNSVCKFIMDEVWYIYILLDKEQVTALGDTTSVNIRFSDTGIKCKADFSKIEVNGQIFGKISLSEYMINHIDQRYVNIELMQEKNEGLKIPASAVFNKSFYTIPKEYRDLLGDFMRGYYDENGKLYYEAVKATIYYEDEKYYYVSMDDFNSGDILWINESKQTYIVGTIGELTGVYCVNRGYAVFKRVNVIEQNDEYCIVTSGSKYGLLVHDYIVLDHQTIKENEVLK